MSNRVTGVKLKALVKTASKTSLSKTSIKFTNDYSTKCFKKENFIFTQLVTNNNNNITLAKKHLFTVKHYSTTSVPVESGSTTPSSNNNNTTRALNPVQYEEWSKEEVCSLLCTPKKNGGANLSYEEVKPLYDAGFKGTSLGNIVNDIKKQKAESYIIDETCKSFPTVARDTIKTVVNWVDNLLKTRLYHLWTADQVKENLCKPVDEGGAGLNEDQVLGGVNGNSLKRIMDFDKSEAIEKINNFLARKDEELAKRIYIWLQKESLIRVSNIFDPTSLLRHVFSLKPDTIIPEEPSYKLVNSYGKNFVFQSNKTLVEDFCSTVARTFDLALDGSIDKQSICTYFIASAPGTGKSRLNQELRNLSIDYLQDKNYPHVKYFQNSVQIFASLKNGTQYQPYEDFQQIIPSRMLYSYFCPTEPTATFENDLLNRFKNVVPKTIVETVSIIRKDRERSQKLKPKEPLIIYLSIDEFQELIPVNLLDQQVKTIVSSVITCWSNLKVLLIPIYSGLSYIPIYDVLRKSTSGYKELITPHISTAGIEDIAMAEFKKNGIPSHVLLENRIVYSNLKKTYGHPRTLEKVLDYIVKTYKTTRDVEKMENKDYVLTDIPMDENDTKSILTTTILGKQVNYSTKIGSQTAKYWEEIGLIQLIQSSNKQYTIAMSWFQFESLTRKIRDNQELWKQFVQAVETCMNDPESKLYDRPFEQFHLLFDMILNQCYLLDGKISMPIKERFRGGRFREDEAFVSNMDINLTKFPVTYKHDVSNEKANHAEMFHPKSIMSNHRDFFDGYTIIELSKQDYFLSYQHKGTKISNDRIASAIEHLEKIPEKTGNKLDKSKSVNILFLNMRLSKSTQIPKSFVLFGNSSHAVKTKYESKDRETDNRTDFEIYFGAYIYTLVFTFLPKSVNVHKYETMPHLLSRLFGVSKDIGDAVSKEIKQGKIKDLEELKKRLKAEPLFDVKLIF